MAIADKIPGGGLTKILWGLACHLIADLINKTSKEPGTFARKFMFYVYIRIVIREFRHLRFRSTKQLKLMWQMLRMFVDLAIAARDPTITEPPLPEFIQKLQIYQEIQKELPELMASLYRYGKIANPKGFPGPEPDWSLGLDELLVRASAPNATATRPVPDDTQ